MTVHAPLQSLIIGHTFLILFIPLLAALFYYSTPYSRRQPIFTLNVLSLTLALVGGIINDAININALLSPQHILSERFHIALGVLGNFQMMLVDSILLARLITVYPLNRVGRVRFMLLMSLPIALKIARMTNTSLLIYHLNLILNGSNGTTKTKIAWHRLPYQKVEWIAQVVDNSYASIVFLWTIRRSRVDTTSDGLMSAATSRQSSAAERIRTLFHFALSNFIIPTVMSIVQLVMVFHIGNRSTLNLSNIALVNTMVSVIGVVFATVWAGKEHRREIKALLDSSTAQREWRSTPPLNGWKVGLHPHLPLSENLAIIESYQSYNVKSTSDKGVSTVLNQGDDHAQVLDVTLLPRQKALRAQICSFPPGSMPNLQANVAWHKKNRSL